MGNSHSINKKYVKYLHEVFHIPVGQSRTGIKGLSVAVDYREMTRDMMVLGKWRHDVILDTIKIYSTLVTFAWLNIIRIIAPYRTYLQAQPIGIKSLFK